MGRGDTTTLGRVIALAIAAGCSAGDDGDFEFGEASTGSASLATADSAPAESDSTGAVDETGSSGAEESSGGDESSGGESSTGDEPLPTVQCTTLDIVVVIDNSDTMTEEQTKLTAAIGPFVAALQAQLPSVMDSIHVGVLSTDASAFVTSTPAATCTPYSSGASWMLYGPTLNTELACATALGVAGDPDERPMQMTIEAISPEAVGVDGPNEDFLREDGPLVIVLVTDEEDDFEEKTEWGSPGDPADWVDAIAARKGGYVEDVVVLSLVGIDKPNACPDYQWNGIDGAELAPRLAEFTESFPRHALGDVCAVDFGMFLNNAGVPQVVQACDNYVEP
jgi:hypothetical protein